MERKKYSNGKIVREEVVRTRDTYGCLPSYLNKVQIEWQRFKGTRRTKRGLVFSTKIVLV